VNESLGKQQKEFYLRQQMAAIQKELAGAYFLFGLHCAY
jgi:ATP-dependent Lon protease